MEAICMEAQDNLLQAKISQVAQANKNQTLTFPFVIGHLFINIALTSRIQDIRKGARQEVRQEMCSQVHASF